MRHLTIRSRLADIERATSLVADFADEMRLGARVRVALTLVLEELISNTVSHGAAAPEAPIHMSLSLHGDAVRLRYEDCGRAFDPCHDLPPDDRDRPPEARRPGGLGWPLIKGYCRTLEYRREGDRNRLELVLPLQRRRPA